MKKIINYISVFTFTGFLFSCTVTNNLYVNNPEPMGKGNGAMYGGLGTGVQPQIDSTSSNGKVNFSNKISSAPILSFGAQFGISNRMDIRLAVHMPRIFFGFGMRLGTQYSFFDKESRFNAALGTDLGFVTSSDSFKVKDSNGALNADIFLPASIRLSDHLSIILTPRYSFNKIYIRENLNTDYSHSFGLSYPELSLGIRIYRFYIETSTLYYNRTLYPHFGVAWLFGLDMNSSAKK